MSISLEKISVQMIEEYYQNNPQIFFDYLDEHIIWIGPAMKQYIEGKSSLLHAFGQENNTLLFRTAQMSSKSISGGTSSACEVLLRFVVYTYYPSGYISIHNQRITIFWKKTRHDNIKEWRIAMIHISNALEMDSRDLIYPIHLDEFEKQKLDLRLKNFRKELENRLILKGEDYSTHYIDYSDIIYICGGKGKFSDIYTSYGFMRVRHVLSDIEKMLPKQFYRLHRSYLVNLLEIVNISRYKAVLRNGDEIPIPEKQYSRATKEMEEYIYKFQL